jgi:MFS family permease
VTTALPTIHTALHASTSTLSWTIGVYGPAFAAMILIGTALGDRFGHRRVFLVGVAVFTLASAGCALSPTAGLLIAARAVQGAGAGLAVPLSLLLVIRAFPVQRRGAAVGIWGRSPGWPSRSARSWVG